MNKIKQAQQEQKKRMVEYFLKCYKVTGQDKYKAMAEQMKKLLERS